MWKFSTLRQSSRLTKQAVTATIATTGIGAYYAHLYWNPAQALTEAEHGLHAPAYEWPHRGLFSSFDHKAIRRGYQVYREVCSSCHSLRLVAWRNLVGVSHTTDEVKEMAAEYEYADEPDDEGNPRKRPGKLADYMPSPYDNEQAARAANQGSLPPDLSLIVKAREGGCDYIFSLLTGYPEDPPAGAQVAPGMNYNPYFPGGGIAMARVLFDGLVEYEDGTPATTSQMASDVVQFLNFCAEPEHDDRKRAGMKVIFTLSLLWALSVWVKKWKWAGLKNRKIVYRPPKN